jgi:hypothetical protein
MGLWPTQGNENHHRRHPRESGDPGGIPAFAGMTGEGSFSRGPQATKDRPCCLILQTAEILRFAQNDRLQGFFRSLFRPLRGHLNTHFSSACGL